MGQRPFMKSSNQCNAHADVGVTASSGQPAFPMGLEMSRVNGVVVVVPGHEQRSGLHRVGSWRPADGHEAAFKTTAESEERGIGTWIR